MRARPAQMRIAAWLSALGAGLCLSCWAAELPDPRGDWRGYTPATVRAAAPLEIGGGDVELLPMRLLPTLASATFFEIKDHLVRTRPGREPQAIVVANGVYDLASMALQLDDPSLLREAQPGVFVLNRPIYVAPGATLVIRAVELRLSVPDMAVLLYRGDLFVIDATVSSWDESSGDAAPRAPIPKAELLLHGLHSARPYLLGLRGSRSFVAASRLTGLGFNGTLAGFGVSLYARQDPGERGAASLRDIAGDLPRPTGVFIGNTISDCFFGFYTNNSGAVLLLGNVFRDNLIYNVDPHDYSGPLIIVRNLATGAAYKHGIILSREVNGALISENLAYGNAGSGIMLDRASGAANIEGNLVFANGGDGIASFESDGAVLADNLVFGNRNNGVYLRNSAQVRLEGNTIDRNGVFGIEVASANLDDTITRDFELDPYRESGDAQLTANRLRRNLDAALTAKGEVRLLVRDNDFDGSGPQFFAGDLHPHAASLLKDNAGIGFRYRPRAAEPPP